ncbi:MAG: glutamate formimidoyltransferase [Acidimicrobiales bacterium]
MGRPLRARTPTDPAAAAGCPAGRRPAELIGAPGTAPAGGTHLECVVNVSEGRDEALLEELAAACGDVLVDRHRDPHHHRAVLTLAGRSGAVEDAARALAAAVVACGDLSGHDGCHPRFGLVDVVPFVPLERSAGGSIASPPSLTPAVAARDRFARWAARTLQLPCFVYGPLPGGATRTLPVLRRAAFAGLAPDVGPPVPHPTAGACAVGARAFLVAYNLWLADTAAMTLARSIARAIRGPAVRSLAFDVGGRAQVSCNLVDPLTVGPAAVHDRVASLAEAAGSGVERCELVGLMPRSVLDGVPAARWESLGLSSGTTIEARLSWR